MFALHALTIAAIAFIGTVSAAPASNSTDIDTAAASAPTIAGAIASGEVADLASTNAAQASGNLFVCTDLNWGGLCANFPFGEGQCLNFQLSFDNSISSAGPDKGFVCNLWTDANCGGSYYSVVNPGVTLIPAAFNDKISSFQCWSL